MCDLSCIPYGIFEDDKKGFRHSIDKLIIDYKLIIGSFSEFANLFSHLSGFAFVSDRCDPQYNSFFNSAASSRNGWSISAFWFPHCNVKYRIHQSTILRNPVTFNKAVETSHFIRVEFNPNKLYENDLFKTLLSILQCRCEIGVLVECDYAVDVSLPCNAIFCKSRGTLVSYDDSRYYGKRHNHGRIKIYNKSKEIKDKLGISVDSVISRCETTFRYGGLLEFHDISSFQNPESLLSLSPNLRSIASLILLASNHGEDKSDLLRRFVPDKRNRDKLVSVLFGSEEDYVQCSEVFFRLLTQYATQYFFWFYFRGSCGNIRFVNGKLIYISLEE